jgi:hypothetical protein
LEFLTRGPVRSDNIRERRISKVGSRMRYEAGMNALQSEVEAAPRRLLIVRVTH